MYEYEADGADKNGAVEVANSATNFPTGCKFVMEILGADVCDQTNLIYAYLVNIYNMYITSALCLETA
jgi:hypothetical protein